MVLNIYNLECGRYEDAGRIARRLLKDLRAREIYRHDLLYRGANVSEQQLENVRIYGTDRNLEDAAHDEFHSGTAAALKGDLSEEHAEFIAREETDPRIIWAFPQKGLVQCIEECEQQEENTPIIIAYNPEFLLYHGHGKDDKLSGREARALMSNFRKEFGGVMLPRFKFKEGKTALDAAAAAYRIDVKDYRK